MLLQRQPVQPDNDTLLLQCGHNRTTLVDPDIYQRFCIYKWRVIKSAGCEYVCRRETRDGKTRTIRLHIAIMDPPPGYEVHHKDLNTFNNLRSNLENLTPCEHRALHGKAG
jgi:hypothetical protein